MVQEPEPADAPPAQPALKIEERDPNPEPGCTEGERGCSREERELGAPLNLGEWS